MRKPSNDSVRLGQVVVFTVAHGLKCDMYRHVAEFHLDLAQLWWCPVSWCTVWKGTPQDCIDHVRGAHDVLCDVKSASLEQFLPPWTVRRQVWSDSLKQQHSGISKDILLFSDINLSLIHHYRIHKRGLPHVAFRRNYMSQLRALLPLLVAQPTNGVLSPVSTGPGSLRQASSAELVGDGNGCGRYVWWRHRFVTFRSSRFRILRMRRVWWSTTVGFRCSLCHGH